MHAHSATGRSVRGEQQQSWNGHKPALWGYASKKKPCFDQLVVAAIDYDFVGTDLTGTTIVSQGNIFMLRSRSESRLSSVLAGLD